MAMHKKLFLSLLLTAPLWSEPQVKVFTLSNRTAASTVEMVRSVLLPGDTVIPEERLQRLVIKADPARLEAVQKLLEQIDVPSPQVWITIDQTGSNPSSSSAGGVVFGPGGGVVAQSNSNSHNVASSQQLLVMSGESGSLTVGEDLPVVQPFWTWVNGLGLVPPGVTFQRVSTGFAVEPTVIGKKVRLRLTPWMSYLGAGGPQRILFSQSSTQVTLNDGETMMVSGGSTSQSSQSQAFGWILGGAQSQASQSSGLVVTVAIKDEAPALPSPSE
jgi:type II secretory pathway component GspD/PulD (secretin)